MKKFVSACVIFSLIVVLMIAFFAGFFKSKVKQVLPIASKVVLASDKLGSIDLKEDNSFKTYIINCKKDMKDVKWKESKEWYKITLGKDDIENLKINGEKGVNKDIYYEKVGTNFILNIKKSFVKGNSLKVDKTNSKRIVVLINKESKVYKYKIVVDAGHGGVDKGASYGDLYEKNITLKIAKYTEQYLKSKDCQVIMTRDTDKFVYLNAIAQINNDAAPDVFISIHVNKNPDIQCRGVSTYYYYNAAGYQKNERMKLAEDIEGQLIKDDSWNFMGMDKDQLLVLNKSTAVCALIECGFISNSGDRAKLTNDAVLKRLGQNISDGVLEYLNASKTLK